VRILTVMDAVYTAWKGYAFSGINNTLGNSSCTVVFSVSVSKTGSYPNSNISRDHQPDARGLETCFSAGTLGCNNAAPPIEMPTDPKNTP
jgi:hypothetical protein